ncbi:MAG: hypothetical protein RBR78_02105 [Flavobacteriaceae bacterium]|jgi:hypothetical protein|nr:hypothetical protein [Flavobacteriaceae bacterium]
MRVFGFFVILITIFGFTTSYKSEYLVIDSKKISVESSTSVGDFTCNYNFDSKDTLFLNRKLGYFYKVPVKEFGCGNFLLNRDFRKTLKEKEFPNVSVNLFDVKKEGKDFSYSLDLNLAGKQKTYKNLILKKENKALNGSISVKFSDFDLVAPKKLGGAIKVKEDIKLSFVLNTR